MENHDEAMDVLEQPEIANKEDVKNKKPMTPAKKEKKKSKTEEKDIEISELNELIQKQQDIIAKAEEQHLRLRAEYDNFRKRSQAEKAAIYGNAVADTIQAILPVADNMERALTQENGTAEDLQKGLQMIENQFLSVFEQLGVVSVGEKGEVFDPLLHNAVSHIEDDSLDNGVITEVMQKGYKLGEKVIRHAMVQVAN